LDGGYSKTGMAYPETLKLKSTRPTARGPRRQVFVDGVEKAATPDEAYQAKVSLVLLYARPGKESRSTGSNSEVEWMVRRPQTLIGRTMSIL
jgi:hypothetical protein